MVREAFAWHCLTQRSVLKLEMKAPEPLKVADAMKTELDDFKKKLPATQAFYAVPNKEKPSEKDVKDQPPEDLWLEPADLPTAVKEAVAHQASWIAVSNLRRRNF